MSKKRISILLFVVGLCLAGVSLTAKAATVQTPCPAGQRWCDPAGSCIPVNNLCILEPPPGYDYMTEPEGDTWNGALTAFSKYINGGVWTWIFGMGVAIAILNGVAAGFQIVMSNGDAGIIGKAKERFVWTAIGLVILLLTGVIMNFINPYAFQNI